MPIGTLGRVRGIPRIFGFRTVVFPRTRSSEGAVPRASKNPNRPETGDERKVIAVEDIIGSYPDPVVVV